MSKDRITMHCNLAVPPSKLFNDWLDSKSHTAFTGAGAQINKKINSEYKAWDGYISGKILQLEENKRILHSWRTSEFPDKEEDSKLEILLEDMDGGTAITLNHWDIPKGDGKKYEAGWLEFYFEPMGEYYGKI
jgi:activator of HSP90 ATPase